MLDLLHRLTEVLQGTLGSPWLWVVVFLVAGLDALLPFMPSETTVITVAVLIGPDLGKLALLAVVAAGGALAGDYLGYWIGRGAGPVALRRLQQGERGREQYLWARAKVERHATALIVAGRYLPGGRVASALATGSMRFPAGRFAALDAAGTSIWAGYSVLIGYIGGANFTEQPAKGLLLAFALGLLTVATIEAVRRIRSRRAVLRLRARDRDPFDRPAERGDGGGPGRPGAELPGVDGEQAGPAHRQGAFLGTCDDGRPER
ncbi:DedA family protein [Amycolatopsis cihanbeyliensis]|uniref:Membrane protein DedA with SNARE-associated domain n=1 Tax=Amycolatopsis cihanbeyliensis TaxID=1128664 RepID=A0A542DJX3_AMYCI|nr:VTT domain-containing protein [Amycolatopsis cihanbeyliensis]TQJ03380.1 membrane protein DedA with SNARE-associated domain [Amycolatopsis cihanbeyliensis]